MTCSPGSDDCKGIVCGACPKCKTAQDKINAVQAKITQCEGLISTFGTQKLSHTATLDKLKQQQSIIKSHILEIASKLTNSSKQREIEVQVNDAIHTSTQLISTLRTAKSELESKNNTLDKQLGALKLQISRQTSTIEANTIKLKISEQCFKDKKALSESTEKLAQLNARVTQVQEDLKNMKKQRDGLLGGPTCSTRIQTARNEQTAQLNKLKTVESRFKKNIDQYEAKIKNKPIPCYTGPADILTALGLKKPKGENIPKTCGSWSGKSGPEIQKNVFGIPQTHWVYPNAVCWNPMISKCVEKKDGQSEQGGDAPIKISHEWATTKAEKDMIAEYLRDPKAFKLKYKKSSNFTQECPDYWTKESHVVRVVNGVGEEAAVCVEPKEGGKNRLPQGSKCRNKTTKDGRAFANFSGYSTQQKANWAKNVCDVSWNGLNV